MHTREKSSRGEKPLAAAYKKEQFDKFVVKLIIV
jgi:hypothetical protein